MSMQLPAVSQLLDHLAPALDEWILTKNLQDPLMVGIHTGGLWVAERLQKKIQTNCPLGSLDISFYRDDYSRKGLNPSVRSTDLPFATEDRHLILVDDVLMSGRTIRAAMNELFDYGRPASITLVVLVALAGRELPIQPDLCALDLRLEADQRIKLSGPEPLALNLLTQAQEVAHGS